MASVKKESFAGTNNADRPAYDDVYYTQSWTTQSFYTLTSIKIYCKRIGTVPTTTLRVYLASSDLPTGSVLATVTYDSSAWSTAYEQKEFTFTTPLDVDANTKYVFEVLSDGTDGNNHVIKIGAESNGTYSGGTGGNWVLGVGYNTDNYDVLFEIWGSETRPNDKFYSKSLVVIGGSEVWYEATAGTMSEFSDATNDINTGNPLSAVDAFQKLFIANKTDLKVMDFVNVKLTTTDVTLSADNVIPLKGDVLTGDGASAEMIVDYIDATGGACNIYGYQTTTAAFISTDNVTGTNDNGSIEFNVSATPDSGPHWYDWTPYSNDTTNFGSMPDSAYLVCRYRGRLVLAGNPNYPHQWYMSKMADPWDWVYSTTDPLGAVAGQDADAGEIGDIIRALIPYDDDYLLFACAGSLHLLTGDPASGGSIDELSNNVGIYSFTSWCKDNNDKLYFFGTNGLYVMDGGRSRPKNISTGVIPNLIKDWALDPENDRVVLSYDPKRNGVLISKVDMSDGSNESYWYDLKTQGFYPESHPEECAIFSSMNYNADSSTYNQVLYGCYDGYIRYFNDSAKSDNVGATSEAVSSYMTLSPILIGDGTDREGRIRQIVFESSGGAASGTFSDTDGFDWDVYKADDAETLIEDIKDGASSSLSGSITGTGRKSRIRQKVRGMYGTIVITNSTISTTWALNRILIEKDIAGQI